MHFQPNGRFPRLFPQKENNTRVTWNFKASLKSMKYSSFRWTQKKISREDTLTNNRVTLSCQKKKKGEGPKILEHLSLTLSVQQRRESERESGHDATRVGLTEKSEQTIGRKRRRSSLLLPRSHSSTIHKRTCGVLSLHLALSLSLALSLIPTPQPPSLYWSSVTDTFHSQPLSFAHTYTQAPFSTYYEFLAGPISHLKRVIDDADSNAHCQLFFI